MKIKLDWYKTLAIIDKYLQKFTMMVQNSIKFWYILDAEN